MVLAERADPPAHMPVLGRHAAAVHLSAAPSWFCGSVRAGCVRRLCSAVLQPNTCHPRGACVRCVHACLRICKPADGNCKRR